MKIRLFIAEELNNKNIVFLNKNQFHYLKNVLKTKKNDEVFLFDNKSGEFKAKIQEIDKIIKLEILEKTRGFYACPNIGVAFAPVKNIKSEFLATKMTELGIKYIQPIFTQRTIITKINLEKIKLNVIEAAEQCNRVDLPEVYEITPLKKFLQNNQENIFIFADESGKGGKVSEVLASITKIAKKIFIIIGPEGGFSQKEQILIRSQQNCYSISLKNRILRTDTAIIALSALVQNYLGGFN